MLHSNGRVARGMVLEKAVANGLPIAPGITFFNEDGGIIKGKLSRQYTYKQFLLAAGEVWFNKQGELQEAVLAPGAMLNKWKINTEARISMDHTGQPRKLVFISPQGAHKQSGEVTADSLNLAAGRVYDLYPNGQIKELHLTDHSWYQGKPYPAGTAMVFNEKGELTWDEFYDDILRKAKLTGNMKHIPDLLPTAEVRRGFLLPAGSLVYPIERNGDQRMVVPRSFSYRGMRIRQGEFRIDSKNNIRSAYLEDNQALNGIVYNGFPDKVQLHPSGGIESARLAYDQLVDGVLIRGAPSYVHFGKSGKITIASLSGDQMIGGLLIKGAPSRTQFDDNGRLLEGTLAAATTLEGIHYQGSSAVSFTRNMQVLQGQLAVHTRINGIWYKKGTSIWFDSKGKLSRGVLASKTTIHGIEIPADSEVNIHATGFQVESSKPIVVGRNQFEGYKLSLGNDGSVRKGLLSNNTTISGTALKAGTRVKINSSGELLGHVYVGLRQKSSATVMVGPQVLSPLPITPPTQAECLQDMDFAMETQDFWLGSPLIKDCVQLLAREW